MKSLQRSIWSCSFAPRLLPRYFSALDDFGPIDQMLAEDVDAGALFQATRLAGDPDPETLEIDAEQADLPKPSVDSTLVWTRSEKEFQALTVPRGQGGNPR